MATVSPHAAPEMPLRVRLLRVFLWVSVVSWGIGLGAKVFDLLVLAGAWSATLPGSLSLLPYGARWPVNPGDFFQPLSLVMVVGILGAIASGWKTALPHRVWLLVPAIMFLIIWVLTPTVFWPMIRDLYGAASGKGARSDADVMQLARRWLYRDWVRVILIAVGFFSSIRAISLPAGGNRRYGRST